MTRQAAVILSYPAHLLQSALTIRSIRRFHPEIDRYIVVIDNWSNLAWSGYVDDAREFYQGLGSETVCATDLDCLAEIWNPWVRQQTIKLYLDQLIPVTSWFFSDGDCVLLESWPVGVRSMHHVPFGELSKRFNQYVSWMLRLPDWSGLRNSLGQYATSSAPPVRDMKSSDLVALRRYIFQVHQEEVWQIHQRRQTNPGFIPSEWELIDCFDTHVQKIPTQYQNRRHLVHMGWQPDSHYDPKFWGDLHVPKHLWRKLPLVRYLKN